MRTRGGNMYCKNCGHELNKGADFCTSCGVSVKKGHHFCEECGAQTNEEADVCVKCGHKLKPQSGEHKSKIIAGLLGIFLGAFGIHRFYLGYTGIALTQLLLSIIGGILTCGVVTAGVSLWGLIEGVLILCDKTITTDASGNELE